jgi:hypothetical protein
MIHRSILRPQLSPIVLYSFIYINKYFPALLWEEEVIFRWYDNDILFVLDQHTWLDFYSTSSPKQMFDSTPTSHFFLLLSREQQISQLTWWDIQLNWLINCHIQCNVNSILGMFMTRTMWHLPCLGDRQWFIGQAHWNNRPQIDISPHSETLSWFWANQSFFLLFKLCA